MLRRSCDVSTCSSSKIDVAPLLGMGSKEAWRKGTSLVSCLWHKALLFTPVSYQWETRPKDFPLGQKHRSLTQPAHEHQAPDFETSNDPFQLLSVRSPTHGRLRLLRGLSKHCPGIDKMQKPILCLQQTLCWVSLGLGNAPAIRCATSSKT